MSCSKDSDCKGQWSSNAVCYGKTCYPSGNSGSQMSAFSDAAFNKYYMYCTFFTDQSLSTTKTAWMVPITSGQFQGRFQLIDITVPPTADSLVVFLSKTGRLDTPVVLKTTQGYFSVNKTTKQIEMVSTQDDAFSFHLGGVLSMAPNMLFSADQSLYSMLSDYDPVSNTIAITMYSDSDPGPPYDASFYIHFADVMDEPCRYKSDCGSGQKCQGQEFARNQCVPATAFFIDLKKWPLWAVLLLIFVAVVIILGFVAYVRKPKSNQPSLFFNE